MLKSLLVQGDRSPVSDAALRALAQHAAALEHLSLVDGAGGGLDGTGLPAVLTGCAALRKLVLRRTELTAAALMDIAAHGQRLRSLVLDSLGAPTADIMRAILAGCPQVTVSVSPRPSASLSVEQITMVNENYAGRLSVCV